MKKQDNDDFRICDNCDHLHEHPSGLTERCWRARNEPFSDFLPSYAEERLSGDKKSCKGFIKVYNRYDFYKQEEVIK